MFHIAEREIVLNPEPVMLDFEVAARNAVTEVFPMSPFLAVSPILRSASGERHKLVA